MEGKRRPKDGPLSTLESNRRVGGRQKGTPKTGGRKAGTPNKKSVWLRDAFDYENFNFERELINAVKTENFQKAGLLVQLLPYLNPKAKDKDIDPEGEQREETTDILALVNIKR